MIQSDYDCAGSALDLKMEASPAELELLTSGKGVTGKGREETGICEVTWKSQVLSL